MGDNEDNPLHRNNRHTAKSDQRFDASQRVKLSTVNEQKDVKNTNGKEKGDISEKENKFVDDTDRNRVHPKDEMKILKHWGYLKKTLTVGHIIDPLIEKGILAPEKWVKLKHSQKCESDTVEEFLYLILNCHHDAYEIFLNALRSRGYAQVANQLEGTDDISPNLSLSSGGSPQNRQVGRPTTLNRIYSRQGVPYVITDPRNGASSDTGNVNVAANTANTKLSNKADESTVKQGDLNRMKEEITDELRQLRANIEKDRDQDRLELQLLQREHNELKDYLAKTKGDREQLQAELTFVKDTVNELKAQIEQKQSEFIQAKERNQYLEEQLKKKTGHLEKRIREKENEKNDLVKSLKTKDEEYKQLQGMLERLKEQHEERHARLKGLTKDRVTLEKEVQLLNKEKKNLEVKIKSLEQHIRTLHENHIHETGDIRQELERQRTLLEEKEKERIDLEKKLEQSVRENENLKRTNNDLEVNLQKTQDEKVHLQHKLHRADMTKYALPPFLAGSKSTRTGWNPKNLRRQ